MNRTSRGFTLVEVIVALAITLLLATTMVLVVRGLLDVWQRSQGEGMGAVEAKIALDQLERDVQAAMMRRDGKAWFDVRVLGNAELPSHGWKMETTLPMKPDGESRAMLPVEAGATIAAARFGRSGVWLRMLTSDYDSAAGASQPVAISYQMGRRAVSAGAGAPTGYALFREKMSARATFEDVAGFTATSPGALTNPENDDVLASHVVDFGVWVLARDEAGRLTRLFPSSNTIPLAAPFPGAGEPAVVDVMIRVLSDEGAAFVQAMEEGRIEQPAAVEAGAWWWSVVEAHSRVYTRRIEMKARPW